MSTEWTRVPYTEDSLERVLACCDAHPGSGFDADLRRRFITGLTRDPGGVIELVGDDGALLVAVVVDTVDSVADCAVLPLIGYRDGLTMPSLVGALLDAAERVVANGPRSGLEVPVEPQWHGWGGLLQARGYALAFTTFEMECTVNDAVEPLALPGPEWRWIRCSSAWHSAYYEVVKAAMVPVPGAYVGSFAEFQASLDEEGRVDWLLVHGERVAGFSCVGLSGTGVGLVHKIGRHPDFRGAGLGALLLARAIHTLAGQGATRLCLDVTASNRSALDLYLKAEFRTVREVQVYRWQAPSSDR